MITDPIPLGGGNTPARGWSFDGFVNGVNTFSLSTELRPTELAFGENCELIGKKSIRPRRGSQTLGQAFGSARVDGLYPFRGGSTNLLLALSGGTLRRLNQTTGAWDTVSGATFTSGLRTRAVKLRGNLYFGNGTDPFRRFNGSIIQSFVGVQPPTGLSVSPQGTTGTSSYTYSVTAVTDKGESLPSGRVTINNGNATLDNTNFNRITFNRRTEAEVIGYNLYGRRTTGLGVTLMVFIDQTASGATITIDDRGTIEPGIWLEPNGDSTDGPRLRFWEQLRGSLVGAGDTNAPDRLYYSGTGVRFESFSPSHNGGWVDVRPGDNDLGVNGLAAFEHKVMVAKQNSVHQFFFSEATGEAILQEVLAEVGCGAPGSMDVMENDIVFVDSERKLRILGYEPNFTAGIRTTSLSEGRVDALFDEINPAQMENLEGIFHNGRYFLAATPIGSTRNSFVLVYDRRYLAFLGKWTGEDCAVRAWATWDGLDGQRRLFAASSTTGLVYEFGTGKTMYNGGAVVTTIRTRNEDLGNSGQEKIWEWVDIRLFQVSGTLNLKTIRDGAIVLSDRGFANATSTGWGIKRWGTTLWGVQTGVSASISDIDRTWRREIFETGNSLQVEITKEGALDDFTLVSIRGRARPLSEEVFDSQRLI